MDKICIIGDILVDVTLRTEQEPQKMRLGGIVHAARALWAMGIEYDIAYFAPAYLDSYINSYLHEFKCQSIIRLGEVRNQPYTILIGEAKEVGNQQYDFLLNDVKTDIDYQDLNLLNNYSKVLMISGNYDWSLILTHLNNKCKVYIDVANNVTELSQLKWDRKYEVVFTSTSSPLFNREMQSLKEYINPYEEYTNKIVLKENRGGSRAFDFEDGRCYVVPSQTQTISHSVGVGDTYAAVAMVDRENDFEGNLYRASWIAADYAATTFPIDFQCAVQRALLIPIEEIKLMEACSVPWEIRPNCNIYIAAPDFDFVNVSPIERLCGCLRYHNFSPRRPIKENGQMSEGADKLERQMLFQKDMQLLSECNMLIAVMLYDDPGTCIEIGLAANMGLPVIVYDPYSRAQNCMLTELPLLVSANQDEIIAEVFIQYSKIIKHGTK